MTCDYLRGIQKDRRKDWESLTVKYVWGGADAAWKLLKQFCSWASHNGLVIWIYRHKACERMACSMFCRHMIVYMEDFTSIFGMRRHNYMHKPLKVLHTRVRTHTYLNVFPHQLSAREREKEGSYLLLVEVEGQVEWGVLLTHEFGSSASPFKKRYLFSFRIKCWN